MVIGRAKAMATKLVLAIAIVVLVLGSSAAGALEGEPAGEGLFSEPGARATLGRAGEVGVVRSRTVQPQLELLLEADGTPRDLAGVGPLNLNLFDDLALVVELDRVAPSYGGGFAWVGQVQGEPLSTVTLAVTDAVMAGTVTSSQGSFQISYAGSGVHAVQELDQCAFPPEAEPIPVDVPERRAADAVTAAVADDGSVIDVMVVYTPSARWAVGGTTAMLNLINVAVTETNQSYANSGIIQRLNLVHAAEVSYTSSGSFKTDLERLQGSSDGYMDNVHQLRDAYYADEVLLLINNTQYCGMAYLMQTVSTYFEDHAFAVVHWGCATGYYSFGHELGHNMGAQHDHYAVAKYNQAAGAYWYSYGYVNTSIRWRTVMAYNDACADSGFNCTRIPYWSNPSVYYGGSTTGASNADNQLTLDNTAWTVANFRVCAEPSAPTNLSATAVPPWQINLTWIDTSSNETGFRIERSSGGSWSTLATVGANATGYADTSATPGTLYSYRVIAYRACGDSAPSNADSATLPVIIGPLVYHGYLIDDDNGGGTSGNGNGYLNCGETVDLTVLLRNEGNTAVEGIQGTLSNPGGTGADDVSWTGNTTSTYPNIAGGVSAGNLLAFDFSIEELAKHGHRIDYDLGITADNWSGGSVSFSLPILCSATADYRHYLPLISK
jgi:hypothetical protein